MSNLKKSQQLGIPFGTASGRLRKQIIFHLMQKCGMEKCYQCGQRIENIENLSIEHKIPWLDSSAPIDLFFDMDNIAFSHLRCNCLASRINGPPKKHPNLSSYQHRGCRCEECTELHRQAQARFRAKRQCSS